ncbi:hypothetical protein JDV02_006400 [Purpureocillium takamizusanense]|uniref:Uncharacterized protein n=1 Tax=Purpureocillium takamizusanense TaxID=2060973 RepID=A0A9Q8VBA6_9HYPO|nr:uncharacterized protein JDV02_006400 [Purpureocillium takamizusanense]UNI20300.1 hypothetical protein JDV02_006400 [Purpureocillium takamizusanense]
MIVDRSRCPAHTRTPWEKPSHRCDYRLRYLLMGLLVVLFAGVMILGIVYTFIRGGLGAGQASSCRRTNSLERVAVPRVSPNLPQHASLFLVSPTSTKSRESPRDGNAQLSRTLERYPW